MAWPEGRSRSYTRADYIGEAEAVEDRSTDDRCSRRILTPMGRTTPLVLLAVVFLVSCPRIPDPERTTVDGHDVFLIQQAHCGIGDCPAAFYINRLHYTPTCGDLPRWLRAEARGGPLFAVAGPDATPPLPFVRATQLARIEPEWIVGVRFTVCQGPKWTIAWAELAGGLQAAVCDADRPRLAAIIRVDCT